MCKCKYPTGWGYSCDGESCMDYCTGWQDPNHRHGVKRKLTKAGKAVD